MVWVHKERMKWECNEVSGFLLSLKVVNKVSHLAVININTGELMLDEQYKHPLDAVAASNKLFADFSLEKPNEQLT